MQKKLFFILLLSLSCGINAGTAVPFLKNSWVNAVAFPLFAATAYYFFDDAGASYDFFKVCMRTQRDKLGQPACLTNAIASLNTSLHRRTRLELFFKELDKQSYYLVGAIGASIIISFLRAYIPEARGLLYIGEKA